jgi:hypothetical protein
VRIVIVAVLAAAADAVLVAHHLQNLVPIWSPPLEEIAWRQEKNNSADVQRR